MTYLLLYCGLCWAYEAYSFCEDFEDIEKEFKTLIERSTITYILPMWAIILFATVCWAIQILIAPVTAPMKLWRILKLYFVLWGVKRMLIKEGILTKQEWKDLMDGTHPARWEKKENKSAKLDQKTVPPSPQDPETPVS